MKQNNNLKVCPALLGAQDDKTRGQGRSGTSLAFFHSPLGLKLLFCAVTTVRRCPYASSSIFLRRLILAPSHGLVGSCFGQRSVPGPFRLALAMVMAEQGGHRWFRLPGLLPPLWDATWITPKAMQLAAIRLQPGGLTGPMTASWLSQCLPHQPPFIPPKAIGWSSQPPQGRLHSHPPAMSVAVVACMEIAWRL